MNIFVLHRDPGVAAQMSCDRHVVKMILESAQMLCTIKSKHGDRTTYKPTHEHHPCTVWAGKSLHNYAWLWNHGRALCEEYTFRYGKVHKCQKLFDGELRRAPCIPKLGLTEFAQAMPEQYRNPDAVIAYRQFYLGEKARFATWRQRPEPLWFTLKEPELEE